MRLKYKISFYGILKSFHYKISSSAALFTCIISSFIPLNIIDLYYNDAIADERLNIKITPNNFSKYIIGSGDYLFEIPDNNKTTYVFYNHGENSAYPTMNKLSIDHPDIDVYINGQNNNLGQANKLKVNQFIIEDGSLNVVSGSGLKLEVGRLVQQSGHVKVSSAIQNQIGLLADDVIVDGLNANFSVFSGAGIGVSGALSLKNGTVMIETDALVNSDNELLVGWKGNVYQSGGRLNIYNSGGVSLQSDEFILSGGRVNTTILNAHTKFSSTGVEVKGRFFHQAGINNVTVSGNNVTGFNLIDGPYIIEGNDSQIHVNAQNNAVGLKKISQPIYNQTVATGKGSDNVSDAFIQNSGNTFITAQGGGVGFYFENSSIKINGGNLTLDASNGGIGVKIADEYKNTAHFVLNDGLVQITATNTNSIGLKSDYVSVNGGSLSLLARDNGKAIDIGSGHFNMKSGNLYLRQDSAANQGWAIYGNQKSTAFFGKNANVETIVDLNASKQLAGLMSFGNVIIEEGSKLSLVIANTSKVLSPAYAAASTSGMPLITAPILESRNAPIAGQFDVANTQTSGESLFYNYKLVLSNDQQDYRLVLTPKSIDNDDKGNISGGNESSNTGSGNESTGTGGGNASTGTGDNDQIVSPPNGGNNPNLLLPSYLLSGANRNSSIALEGLLSAHSNDAAFSNLNRAFDKLYNSRSQSELEQYARGLTAHATTHFPTLTMMVHDRTRLGLQSQLDIAARQTELPTLKKLVASTSTTPLNYGEASLSSQTLGTQLSPILSNRKDNLRPNNKAATSPINYWALPIGATDRHNSLNSSHTNLKAKYGGISAGFASRGEHLTLGVGVGYLYGDLSGEDGYQAKSNSFLLTAGLKSDKIALTNKFAPSFNLIGIYAYSQYDQMRRDILGGINQADIGVNSLSLSAQMILSYDIGTKARLQPKLGVDYSFVHLGSYKEQGGAVPLSVDRNNYNSIRPNIGADITITANNLEITAYGLYRYEMINNSIDLKTSFIGFSDKSFISSGENISRSSGVLGINTLIKATDKISILSGYDFLITPQYTSHQFYMQGNAQF